MRNQIKVLAVSALLAMPVSLLAAETTWYNPKTWFNKSDKLSSTTVTGNVDSVKDQVIFKTLDGQLLLLVGSKAAKVGQCGSDAKIRVFGNVYKPSDKYPTGALQVRNYRVLEEAAAATENAATETTAEPEPYSEPALEPAPEATSEVVDESNIITAIDNDNEEDDDVVVEVVEEINNKIDDTVGTVSEKTASKMKTYVVQSGDTLGKISSKVLGTTTAWKKIAEANGITNPKHLKVGMTLNIPE